MRDVTGKGTMHRRLRGATTSNWGTACRKVWKRGRRLADRVHFNAGCRLGSGCAFKAMWDWYRALPLANYSVVGGAFRVVCVEVLLNGRWVVGSSSGPCTRATCFEFVSSAESSHPAEGQRAVRQYKMLWPTSVRAHFARLSYGL